jgi:hypothetical protein
MRGADLRRSASAPAAARKQWPVGLVRRPTYNSGNGREPPHLLWQQVIIFLTLHLNSFKKVPRALLLHTIRMNTFGTKWHRMAQSGQEMAQSGTKMDTAFGCTEITNRVSSDGVPAVSARRSRPLGETEYAHRRRELPLKRQEAPFFDMATRLPDSKRRVGHGGRGREKHHSKHFF